MSKKYFPLPIVLLGLLSVSCNDVLDGGAYDSSSLPSLVLEAKKNLESSNVEVSLLNMEKAYHSESNSEKRSKANISSTSDLYIDWNNFSIKQEDGMNVVYVPINQKKSQAFSIFSEDGRSKNKNHQIYSTLIIRKNSSNKELITIIGTYLYGRDMKEQAVKILGIDFESSDFSGYFITSRLDGTMLAGRCIENGTTKFIFRQNPLPPKEREEKTDSIKTHGHQHLFLNLRPITIKTKSSNDTEDFMYFCSTCWRPWDQCTCVEIEATHMCQVCHTEIVGGLCDCYCPYCFKLHAECTCSSGNTGNGGGNSGSSGGNSGGGGSTGGGSTGGGGGSTPSTPIVTPKEIAIGNVVSKFNESIYNRTYNKATCGYCLRGWKTIWQNAGIPEYANCQYAKDFGPFLINYGFQEVPITWDFADIPTPQQYTPQIGDTRVWDTYPGQKVPAGHIDWWNGTNWVSDYKQVNPWWPGNGYKEHHPAYKIYR